MKVSSLNKYRSKVNQLKHEECYVHFMIIKLNDGDNANTVPD